MNYSKMCVLVFLSIFLVPSSSRAKIARDRIRHNSGEYMKVGITVGSVIGTLFGLCYPSDGSGNGIISGKWFVRAPVFGTFGGVVALMIVKVMLDFELVKGLELVDANGNLIVNEDAKVVGTLSSKSSGH
jgi:hypothetical protein